MIHKLHYYNLAKDEIAVQMKRVGNYTTTHLCPHEEPNFYYVLALCHKPRLVTSELVPEYFMTVERPVVNILLLTYNTFIMDEIDMGGITIDVNEKNINGWWLFI